MKNSDIMKGWLAVCISLAFSERQGTIKTLSIWLTEDERNREKYDYKKSESVTIIGRLSNVFLFLVYYLVSCLKSFPFPVSQCFYPGSKIEK